jgi:short-subunit dehydrogenase
MARRKLHGLRALVTGASSGIGRALAVELARRGTKCLLIARRNEELAEVREATREVGTEASLHVGDITDAQVRTEAIANAHRELGGLDLLVNNAGISASGDVAGESPGVLRRIFEVNFFATVELTQAALPLMAKGRTPMVVNVSSILGHRGIPFTAAYCASKFALTGWSQSLRAELAPRGIDVLLVSPGTTDTGLASHLVDERIKLPWADMKGVTAQRVALATVRAIEQGKHEIVPNWRGWWMLLVHRVAPGIVDRVMANLARDAVR